VMKWPGFEIEQMIPVQAIQWNKPYDEAVFDPEFKTIPQTGYRWYMPILRNRGVGDP